MISLITGSSKGLGKALAQELLKQGRLVIGVSRDPVTEVTGYRHICADLGKPLGVQQVFKEIEKDLQNLPDLQVIFNVANLGEVKPVGQLTPQRIDEALFLNFTGNLLMSNELLRLYGLQKQCLSLIFISSGAALRALPSWGLYCSTKAASEMLFNVLQVENPSLRVLIVDPGVMETEMQAQLRSSSEKDFPLVKQFREYKEQGLLRPPEEIARKIIELTKQPHIRGRITVQR